MSLHKKIFKDPTELGSELNPLFFCELQAAAIQSQLGPPSTHSTCLAKVPANSHQGSLPLWPVDSLISGTVSREFAMLKSERNWIANQGEKDISKH